MRNVVDIKCRIESERDIQMASGHFIRFNFLQNCETKILVATLNVTYRVTKVQKNGLLINIDHVYGFICRLPLHQYAKDAAHPTPTRSRQAVRR